MNCSVQLLNGEWDYRIGHAPLGKITVPFSTLPVGHSECIRRFDCAAAAPKTFLRLDGINYAAAVFLNGTEVGRMLPYCTYIFDITDVVLPQGNELKVELEDITPVFGPSEGWENYGGIPRDVMLLFRDEQYMTDVVFTSAFPDGYDSAQMCVAVRGKAPEGAVCRVTLSADGRVAAAYEQALNAEPVPVRVSGVRLWSPDDPFLYTLTTELVCGGEVKDRDERSVGFREFVTEGRRFRLNGKPVFLTGVCYHELYGTAGHLVPPEQTEKDFRTIKELGCNFVRLVHYPHNRATLELADRMGLMVSEEPGLWWSDTSDPQIHDGSIEVLKRTIRRDICHPSIVFWLCFNECKFTAQYLIDSAKACREADPSRLVSGANCMSLEDTPVYFKLCGFDFYTMHPYAATPDRMIASVKALNDMPLMFTEWGGYYVTDNPHLFEDFVDTATAFWRQPEDGDVLTGACYWCFADMYEFGRRRPAVRDGILYEGLVDTERRPHMVFDSFRRAFARLNEEPDAEASFGIDELDLKPERNGREKQLELPAPEPGDFDAVLEDMRAPVERYVHSTKRNRLILVGPRLRGENAGLSGVPAVSLADRQTVISVERSVSGISLIGGTCSRGYPIGGEYGEIAVYVDLNYSDGTETIRLCSGVDVATVFGTYGPSRIRPKAENAEPAVRFHYDRSHEQYVLHRMTVPSDPGRLLKSASIRAADGFIFLTYAAYCIE